MTLEDQLARQRKNKQHDARPQRARQSRAVGGMRCSAVSFGGQGQENAGTTGQRIPDSRKSEKTGRTAKCIQAKLK